MEEPRGVYVNTEGDPAERDRWARDGTETTGGAAPAEPVVVAASPGETGHQDSIGEVGALLGAEPPDSERGGRRGGEGRSAGVRGDGRGVVNCDGVGGSGRIATGAGGGNARKEPWNEIGADTAAGGWGGGGGVSAGNRAADGAPEGAGRAAGGATGGQARAGDGAVVGARAGGGPGAGTDARGMGEGKWTVGQ